MRHPPSPDMPPVSPAAEPVSAKILSGQNFSWHLHTLKAWRDDLAGALQAYQAWAEEQGLTEGQDARAIAQLVEEIHSDKLTVALAAEHSRGKTELLNAIFFADVKQRLLPSGAGRTTLCPTELRFDEDVGACVRLLPIETRKTALTINEYRQTPIHWTTIHLHRLNSPDEISTALLEVTRTKKVHIREAQELGLYDPERARRTVDATPTNDMIDIPVWRHAIVNYPHPLLKQGLVVLDTPGLNALGVEPELTLSMLPSAQTVVFVLGADAGVTKSDLDVWTHITRDTALQNHMVVLNKIDIMWDELLPRETIAQNVSNQVEDVAHVLGVNKRQVFPVSAQKALIGKIRSDTRQIDASGIEALESFLVQTLVPQRHMLMRDRILRKVSARIESDYALLKSRWNLNREQHEKLSALHNANRETVETLVQQVRDEKIRHDQQLSSFTTARATLAQQATQLLNYLSIESVDTLVEDTRRVMEKSWTTNGLRTAMQSFFASTVERMHAISRCANEIHSAVEQLYRRAHTEFGLPRIAPPQFSLTLYYLEFKRLEQKAEAFRTRPSTIMLEQQFVIDKFFSTLANQARAIFLECDGAAKNWFKVAVSPLFVHMQQHRAAIESKLQMLRKIHEDAASLDDQLAELLREKENIEQNLGKAEELLTRIQRPLQ